MNTSEFFEALYGSKLQGCLSLWDSVYSFHLSPEQYSQIPQVIEKLHERDVYFGVCLRPSGLTQYQRGTADQATLMPGLWLDVDILSPGGHAADNLPKSREEALELVYQADIKPTIVVDSGGGLHCYVLFDKPLLLSSTEERSFAKRLNVAYQESVRKHFATKGYTLDKTANIDRVLRVPGTNNHKLKTLRYVVVRSCDGPRYSVEQLTQALNTTKSRVPERYAAVQLPPSEARKRVTEKLKSIKKDGLAALAKAIVKGEAISASGQRDLDLFRMCSVVSKIDPDTDPAELVKIFLPTIVATQERDGDWDVDDVLAKCEDKLRRKQAESREQREKDRLLYEAFIDPSAKIDQLDQEHQERFEKWAAEHRCSPAEFLKRLIIQRDDAFYIFSNGVYMSPVRDKELLCSLPRDWKDNMPIEWNTLNADGVAREKTLNELKRDYCTVARKLLADLSISESRYEEATQVFIEAVCQPRKIEPKFHSAVQRWLELLGGSSKEKLLDFTACLTRLDQYCCALYFSGGPGTGKSLYAKGVARIWTEGSPTEMKRILDNFNADLAKCPLVFADEELPTTYKGQRSTAQIRELITSKGRTLSRKHLPNADLVGATRIILAANNENLLAVGDEDLTPEDLAAFGARFLHVRTSDEAKEYLENLGGQPVISAWVDEDIIAEHVLWLAANRKVVPGKRFIVEGEPSSLQRILATKGKWTGLACEWLARYLDAENAAPNSKIRVGNEKLLVNAVGVADQWDLYIRSEYCPSVQLLGRSIKHIRTGTEAVESVEKKITKYHVINVEMLLSWAEENQIGDIEKMRQKINAPIVNKKDISGASTVVHANFVKSNN